ncbi:11804_t:CDS:2, partial [Cetraspora pellucida]
ISVVNNKTSETLNYEEYRKIIDIQLHKFKEFDKKALKIDDFIHMIGSGTSLIKELMNMNLKSTGASLNEIDLVDKIDQNLLKWIEDYTNIARKFKQFCEDLTDFNKNDDLVLFNIQENLLTEVNDVREHLTKKSNQLDKPWYFNKEDIKKKIDKDFLHVIQLKQTYDLTTELECIRSRLKFFDQTFIQRTSDFCEKLTYELKLNNDLVKIFKECEPYLTNFCLNCIIENLSEIDCLVKTFCKRSYQYCYKLNEILFYGC